VTAWKIDLFYDLMLNQFTRPGIAPGSRAQNINTIDEVPDSSWFTNRILAKPLSIEQAVRGPLTSDGPVRYTAPSVIFEQDGRSFEVGGFQPFEAYDTALANLDPTLTRRPAPESVTEALAEFPEGLTTAELASVMRPSDLVDADLEATAAELAELEATGSVAKEPAGADAIWRVPATATVPG